MRGGAHFAGTIAELPVADLIQMLLLVGKQGVITVARDGLASQVWCAAGEIVDAESALLTGAAALYRILGFEHGALVAELRDFRRERTIFGNPTGLLLEGARRKDEAGALRARLGGERRCYRRAEAAPEPTALSAMEVVLLRSLAEARTVSQVLTSSDQGELETLTLLAGWMDAGLLLDTGLQPTPPPAASVDTSGTATRPAASGGALGPRPSWGGAAPLQQVSRSWWWGVFAALLLVPGGYLLGASSARTPARRGTNAAEAPPPRAAVDAAPPSYTLELQVEPADAQIALDGAPPTVGHLEARLLRNGLVHELRVTASGFIPTSIRFLDAPPPQQLRLEPLSLPTSACESPVASASLDEEGTARVKLYRRAGGARDTARRERGLETRGLETGAVRPQTRGPGPAAKGSQRQVLDRHEPVIDVIN